MKIIWSCRVTSQLSLAIFIASRSYLGAQKCCNKQKICPKGVNPWILSHGFGGWHDILKSTFLSPQISSGNRKNSQRKLRRHSTRSDNFHDDHLNTWVILLSDPGSIECKNVIWTLKKMRYRKLWSPIGRNTSNKVMIW